MPQLRTLILLTMLASCATGCSVLHDLQPHRLRKLNSGPAPSFDPEFGVLDSNRAADLASMGSGPGAVVRAQNSR